MTDYKQLCAELVELGSSPARSVSELAERMSQVMDLADRARVALAEPTPEKWDRPTLDEMRQIFDDHAGLLDDTPTMWWIDFRSAAKVLLDRWGK